MVSHARFASLLGVLMLPSICHAHGGRTDSSGGHNDRRSGGYHYHSGGPARTSSDVTPLARVDPPSPRRTAVRTTARTSISSVRTTASQPFTLRPSYATRSAASARPESPQLDPMVVQAEADAKVLLDRGAANETARDYDGAIRDFLRVLRNWPKTSAAKQARDRLAHLRANEPLRIWKSKIGGHSVEARYVSEEGDRIVLKTAERKTVRIKFDDLITKDRLYVIMRRKPL